MSDAFIQFLWEIAYNNYCGIELGRRKNEMTKKIVQVKRRNAIWESTGPCAMGRKKSAGSYVVKSRYAALREELNQKYIRSNGRSLSDGGESRMPIIGKALQQKEKYVKKGGPCMVKKEIGARF